MRSRWFAPVLAALAALVLFLPSLWYSWTFDDVHLLTPPSETETRSLTDVWSSSYWPASTQGLFRPLTSTTFWVEGRTHAPFALRHGVNVLLHAAVTALLVLVLLDLRCPPWAAGMAGMLFAVHPVHVEAVAGLVGRSELLAALFTLLAVRAGCGTPRRRTLLAVTVLSFLAASSKEWTWALPVFLVAARLARGMTWQPSLLLASGVGVGLHLVLRRMVLGGWLNSPDAVIPVMDNPLVLSVGLDRFRDGLAVTGLVFRQLAFPWVQSPDVTGQSITLPGSWADPRVLLALAGLGALAWGSWHLRKPKNDPGRRALALGSAWALAGILLLTNLLLTLGVIFADRLLYWPSLAGCLLLGGLLTLAASRVPRWGLLGAGLALAVAYTVQSAAYLPAWANDRALFAHAVETTPRSQRAWYNFGRYLQAENNTEGALRAFHTAAALDSTFGDAHLQRALSLMQIGRHADALDALRQARQTLARTPHLDLTEATLLLESGHPETAAPLLEQVLQREPDWFEAAYNLGRARADLGDPEAAAVAWARAARLRPEDPRTANNLAWLLHDALGRSAEAESWARRAAALEPNSPVLLDTLAQILFSLGQRTEALGLAERAAALDSSAYYREQRDRMRSESPELPDRKP